MADILSVFKFPTGAGVSKRGMLVDRIIENRRIIFEDVLGAVAVMKVPVHHQNAAKPQLLLSVADPDGNIVVKAKSAGL